jgi:hypothetical protein
MAKPMESAPRAVVGPLGCPGRVRPLGQVKSDGNPGKPPLRGGRPTVGRKTVNTPFRLPTFADVKRVRIVSLYATMN